MQTHPQDERDPEAAPDITVRECFPPLAAICALFAYFSINSSYELVLVPSALLLGGISAALYRRELAAWFKRARTRLMAPDA